MLEIISISFYYIIGLICSIYILKFLITEKWDFNNFVGYISGEDEEFEYGEVIFEGIGLSIVSILFTLVVSHLWPLLLLPGPFILVRKYNRYLKRKERMLNKLP